MTKRQLSAWLRKADVVSWAYFTEGYTFAQACWTYWHNQTCKPCEDSECPF